MTYIKLCSPSKLKFLGCTTSFEDAEFVILGFPLDQTSNFRKGSKMAPSFIRHASSFIETYSFRTGLDADELRICDIGDLDVKGNIDECLMRGRLLIEEILKRKKRPIIIGGEHTISLSVARCLKNATNLIFDAHLDMRDEYAGRKVSHSTFVRRIVEEGGPDKVIIVGVRATSKDELEYANENCIAYFTSKEVREKSEEVADKVKKLLSPFPYINLSIDLDVIDPCFAPAVSYPEPEGISPTQLLDTIQAVCDKRFISLSVVEGCPQYDQGITSILAAKIICETLCIMKKACEG